MPFVRQHREMSGSQETRSVDRSTDAIEDAPSSRWPDETVDERSIKAVIRSVCAQHLDGRPWNELDPRTTCVGISRDIADGVVDACRRVVGEGRGCKLIVHTVVYENDPASSVNGRVEARCLWDANTDRLVHDNYANEHVVCNSQVYFSYGH